VIPFEELCTEVLTLRSALITTHISPDADAIGSSCALALGLNSLKKRAVVYLADPLPRKLKEFTRGVSITNAVPAEQFDGVVVVDNAAKRRIGERAEEVLALGRKTFNVDHHISNERFAELNYIEPQSASSAEIVLKVLKQIGAQISPQTASLLLAGLMEDTGSFRFTNTCEATLRNAAELVALGAEPNKVANALYFNIPLRLLRLRSLVMGELELLFDGRVALAGLSSEAMRGVAALTEDAEGLIDEVRSVEGTLIAVLVREVEGNKWKVSLRSKDERLDVNALAAQFGGGGHRPAAGCTIAGTIQEVRAVLEHAIAAALASM
jgi:bifunctional oligoribonuclease and PAP phosphatase NrnA